MKRIIIVLILIGLMTAQAASASIFDDVKNGISGLINSAKTLSFTSYSSSVPVQIGYDSVKSFWVLTATIGWQKDQLTLIKLDSGSQDKISSSQSAKTQTPTSITFNPQGSYETAPMTRSDIQFKQSSWESCSQYGCGQGKVAAYTVQTGAWLTTTMYQVSVNSQTTNIEVGMNSPSQVNIGQGVFVENLGILPNGANFPGGNWMYIFNPDSQNYELYSTIDVQNAIGWFNGVGYPNPFFDSYDGTWNGVWQYLKSKGRLPQKPILTATKVEGIVENGDYKYIKLTYPKTAASSMISVYIPSTLANTIIINIGGSKAQIVGTPTITAVKTGQNAQLSVVIKNNGGDDYISVKPTSVYYTFTPIGDSTQFLKNGETKTFTFWATALYASQDVNNAQITILADGSDPYSGDSTTAITGTIYGSGENTDAKLTARAVLSSSQILSDAPIIINGDIKGYGIVTVTLPKGQYVVQSQNVSGYYAPLPRTITMNGIDQTADLTFTATPQVQVYDYTWIFWIALIIIIGYLVYRTGIGKAIISNPVTVVLLVVVLVALYLIYWLLTSISNWFSTLGGIL